MIDKETKDRMDPEVYEFYRGALDGPGFSFPFDASMIKAIRDDEFNRHEKNTSSYPCESFDLTIERDGADPLPIRIYSPRTVAEDKSAGKPNIFSVGRPGEKLPVLLYFHGGGFIMGSIYDHDPLCGKLADCCRAIVVSVEYRLAPEYPFPACIDDARDAANWAYEHISDFGGDPGKLMAGGDSSGANISAVLALMSKEKDDGGKPLAPPLSYLILFYGVYGCHDLEDSDSAGEFGGGEFVLPNDMMNACMDMYLPKDKFPDGIYTSDYRLAPGRDGDLTGFPPSINVTCEFDPLRDDGEAFAKKLKESGSKVDLIRMNGMMHGFVLYWQNFSRAKELLEDIGKTIIDYFG